MAIAFGGAVLLAMATRSHAGAVLGIAAIYERAFWAAVGVLVMTGIGNAAAFGSDLPAPGSSWGAAFMAKLFGVAALALLSVPRTVAIVHLRAAATADAGAPLARLYGATAIVLVAILAVAVWLTHG